MGEADVLVVAGNCRLDKFDLDVGRVFMPIGLEVTTVAEVVPVNATLTVALIVMWTGFCS